MPGNQEHAVIWAIHDTTGLVPAAGGPLILRGSNANGDVGGCYSEKAFSTSGPSVALTCDH